MEHEVVYKRYKPHLDAPRGLSLSFLQPREKEKRVKGSGLKASHPLYSETKRDIENQKKER